MSTHHSVPVIINLSYHIFLNNNKKEQTSVECLPGISTDLRPFKFTPSAGPGNSPLWYVLVLPTTRWESWRPALHRQPEKEAGLGHRRLLQSHAHNSPGILTAALSADFRNVFWAEFNWIQVYALGRTITSQKRWSVWRHVMGMWPKKILKGYLSRGAWRR